MVKIDTEQKGVKGMRGFLFALFLALCVSFPLTAEVTARFTPLADNERLAFSREQIRWGMAGWQHNATFYAVRNNDIEDKRELFTQEDVIHHLIQFTNDFRTVFFTMRGRPPNHTRPIYVANGSTGEIRRLIHDAGGGLIKSSVDGRFVGIVITGHLRDNFRIIRLIDVANESMQEFEFRTTRAVTGGHSIFSYGYGFRIYAIFEGDHIGAVAILDPLAMELNVLWDRTHYSDTIETHLLPTRVIGDGLFRQLEDPNIRLRWR